MRTGIDSYYTLEILLPMFLLFLFCISVLFLIPIIGRILERELILNFLFLFVNETYTKLKYTTMALLSSPLAVKPIVV